MCKWSLGWPHIQDGWVGLGFHTPVRLSRSVWFRWALTASYARVLVLRSDIRQQRNFGFGRTPDWLKPPGTRL